MPVYREIRSAKDLNDIADKMSGREQELESALRNLLNVYVETGKDYYFRTYDEPEVIAARRVLGIKQLDE